jgi:hypothetical protein
LKSPERLRREFASPDTINVVPPPPPPSQEKTAAILDESPSGPPTLTPIQAEPEANRPVFNQNVDASQRTYPIATGQSRSARTNNPATPPTFLFPHPTMSNSIPTPKARQKANPEDRKPAAPNPGPATPHQKMGKLRQHRCITAPPSMNSRIKAPNTPCQHPKGTLSPHRHDSGATRGEQNGAIFLPSGFRRDGPCVYHRARKP